MNDWPFVSVLISTKDRRPDLARALASLAVQDYPRDHFAIVVVEETDAGFALRAAGTTWPLA